MGMFAVSWSVSTRLWGRAAFSTALPDQTGMSDTLLMPFTVLSAEFAHETNTFSRRHTTHADFMARSRCLQSDAAIAARGHANTELGGFLDVARLQGWQLIHVLSASANPGGPVTEEAFERLAGLIVDAAHRHRDALDGIALGLHGAMSTTRHDDGEGELLGRLRAVVGPDLPIAITLDLHANVTRAMCAQAQIIVSYQTYPHVDMRRTGAQAAGLLHRAMAGEIRPVTLRATLPMLGESSGGRTDCGPMLQWLAEARAYEAAHADAFAVSLNAGFSHADLPEMGPTVLVTCQGALAQHQSFADHLAGAMWDARFTRLTDYLSVAQAAARCLDWPAGRGPLVVADYADNPGGGAYGDATSLLAALLDAGVPQACFGPMVDPAVAAQLQGQPVGAEVDVLLGGKSDPRLGGGPLALRGRLRWRGEGLYTGDGPMIGGQQRSWGPTAVLQVQGIAILVVTHAAQMWDQQQFKAFGIDPQAHRVVALKSAQHFRAAFEPIAGEVIVCDSGALAGPDCTTRRYERAPRPVFPLEQGIDLAQWRTKLQHRR
jgi:microcystin degradation protein MlrC